MLKSTLQNFNTLILRRRLRNLIYSINKDEYDSFKIDKKELTNGEKELVTNIWGRLKFAPPHLYYAGIQMFKSAEHFSPLWLTAPAMYPRIILALEDPVFQSALVHKAGFSTYLEKIKQPRNIVKCMDGQYFDEDMNPISKSDAIDILSKEKSSIIKSTYGSCQGKSIQKICPNENISKILDEYHGNLVCQEIIQQSPEMAKFHPSSVNTFRVVSLFINGHLSICEIILRIGQSDSIVDNAGAGGIMIGCNENGQLRDYGYDHFGTKHFDNGNGLKFKGQVVDISRVLESTRKYHTYYFPTMGVVAWDWSIGKDNAPIFIEANLGGLQLFPDITTSQLAKGAPFFGDRTEEVIDFTNSHEDRIWKGLKI